MEKISNLVSFNGLFSSKPPVSGYTPSDDEKKYIQELTELGEDCFKRAKEISTRGSCSSDPKGSDIEYKMIEEGNRLKNTLWIDGSTLKEKATLDKETGILYRKNTNIPINCVVTNNDNSIIEYKDGKPVTIIKKEDNNARTDHRLIKYEYPNGSYAALKTETAILRDYNSNWKSLKVPKLIQQETKLNIYG